MPLRRFRGRVLRPCHRLKKTIIVTSCVHNQGIINFISISLGVWHHFRRMMARCATEFMNTALASININELHPCLTSSYRHKYYRVAQKIATIFVRLVRLVQILTDFLNYFTVRIRRKFVIILSLKIPPHLKCVATLPCEMSTVLKATTEKNTTSVTTHFKNSATGNNVFIVSVIV